MRRRIVMSLAVMLVTCNFLAEVTAVELAAKLRQLDTRSLQEESPTNVLSRELNRRIEAANRRSSVEWDGVHSRAEWEEFRNSKIRALSDAVRVRRDAEPVAVELRGEIERDGDVIRKIVYESRLGLLLTANLYCPLKRDSAPGILLSHSHHSPKSQVELQVWAGCGHEPVVTCWCAIIWGMGNVGSIRCARRATIQNRFSLVGRTVTFASTRPCTRT